MDYLNVNQKIMFYRKTQGLCEKYLYFEILFHYDIWS